MKLLRTKGRGALQTAETLAALEARGGAALDSVLPVVRRIVADVRQKGDRALLRYAAQFDGLAGPEALRVSREEMAAAWESIDTDLRDALAIAAEQIRAFARFMDYIFRPWPLHRAARSATRLRRLLCAQRPSSATLHTAHDGDSRAGSWRRASSGRVTQTRA
jgi:hypothetical protein